MKNFNKIGAIVLFAVVFVSTGMAQPAAFKPDISRALFHSKLDEAQVALLNADGKKDQQLAPYTNEEVNLQLTYQATSRIDDWQKAVEYDANLNQQEKIGLLRGMTDLIKSFTSTVSRSNKEKFALHWRHLPDMLNAFEDGILLESKKASLTPVLYDLPYEGGILITNNFVFIRNPHAEETRQFLFLKFLKENPKELIPQLNKESVLSYPFADSLIVEAAKSNPDKVLTYAQAAASPLGKKIRAGKHPLVKLIGGMANDNRAQLFMPFLDQLYEGKVTKEEITNTLKDSIKYYSLLVKTQIDNTQKIQNGQPTSSAGLLSSMLKRKSLDEFVMLINELHEAPAPIRFKSIQALNTEELYYLIVLNEAEIYTSSYLYVFNRLFEQMPVKNADSLLEIVHYDRYKKFITMSSNYNTLDKLFGLMSPSRAHDIMIDFVNNLDKGVDEEDIEDAVDVANAYASIKDTTIKKWMLDQVLLNYQNAISEGNIRGKNIYHLEKLIMLSSDPESKVNISDSLGIQPIFSVNNEALRDNNGRIVMQMYFYGDGGGKGSFNTLMGLMGDRNKWKITSTPEWVQFTSISEPVPFVLFANRALDEDDDLDEKAQWSLINWMSENGYSPSITVHRGHSYFLPSTIEKMQQSQKVVVLGSCGAYNNLKDILKISPEAYIIASKQVGYGVINIQLFMYLINELKKGKDISWATMMDVVAGNVGSSRKNDFEDYIFPHQNLGAIFIKAYKRISNQDDDLIEQTK